MEENRKDIDKILKLVDNLIKDVAIRTGNTKANAYTVRLTDYYAIELRDEFNRLDGEYNALVKVKNKIIEIIEEKY